MPQTNEQVQKEVVKTISLSYLKHMPKNYDPASPKKYPLVIFLHGAGERGNDIEKVKIHGIPKLVEEAGSVLKGYEFIAISPQCPERSWWTAQDEEFDLLLESCIENLNADTSRIYLTGLSMGGYGTWHNALRHPHAFAAIAPICGGVESIEALENLVHLPTWVFHGAMDSTVPLKQSADAVAQLNNLGGNVKFTVYPELNHNSWTVTYENPYFYKWLFEQVNPQFEL